MAIGSWGNLTVVAAGTVSEEYDEANAVQLPTGRIVMILRHDLGATGYARSVSDDDGVTWSTPVNVITQSPGNTMGKPSICLLSSGLMFMLCRGPLKDTVFATSNDYGVTWSAFTVFGAAGQWYEYASVVALADGTIGAAIAQQPATDGTVSTVVYQRFSALGAIVGAPVTIVSDGWYNAFPGLVQLPNGRLLVAYRKGVTHFTSDGVLVFRTSDNAGVTWTVERELYSAGPGNDARDIEISTLRDGTMLAAFFVTMASGALIGWSGVGTQHENGAINWGSFVRIRNDYTAYGIPADGKPLQLASGKILVPLQVSNTGQNSGTAVMSAVDALEPDMTRALGPLAARRSFMRASGKPYDGNWTS